ncbi:beta-ketoacyl reductase, partial [Burkholderia thailandensis]
MFVEPDATMGEPARAVDALVRTLDGIADRARADVSGVETSGTAAPISVWYCADLARDARAPIDVRAYDRLLTLLQALAKTRAPLRRVLLAGVSESLAADAWPALVTVLAPRRPALAVTPVLFDHGTPEALWVGALLQEARAAGGAAVRYAAGERSVAVLARAANAASENAARLAGGAPLRAGGCYLLTGGLGGLGRLFAVRLMRRYGARVVALGRSAHDAGVQASVAALCAEAGAGTLRYLQADVCDAAAMAAVLDDIGRHEGRLNGVIHAAGCEDRASLADKSLDDVHAVLAPKLAAATVLDRLTAGLPLDFVCLFSSLAGIVGDFGCGAYALGNRLLMSYAQRADGRVDAHGRRRRVVAIAWPLWRDGAMGFDDPVKRDRYLAASGQRMLDADEGFAWFERLLASPSAAPVVLAGERARIVSWLGSIDGAPVADASPGAASSGAAAPNAASDASRDTERAEATDAAAPIVAAGAPAHAHASAPRERDAHGSARLPALRGIAARVLGADAALLDEQASFADLGFDSIGLMDFARAVGEA